MKIVLIFLELVNMLIIAISIMLLIYSLVKKKHGIKIILVGIEITIVGGFISLTKSYNNFIGFGYVNILLGIAISIIGLLKIDDK